MIILYCLEWFKTALFKNEKTSYRRLIILKEMKTLKFPNQEEAYEIVDAYAREQIAAASGGAKVYTATIGTSWTEDSDTGVKYQTVSISGVTADHTAKVDAYHAGANTSDDYAIFVEQQNQFLEFITNGYAETVSGGIKFYIFGDTNTITIPIIVEVV